MKPIINPTSEKIIKMVSKRLPQSTLITGEAGVGLSTIACYIAKQHDVLPTVILPEKDEVIDIDKGIIGIEAIRSLFNVTRMRDHNNRIIIIDYAERMTHQAQNAFLKLLEEPGKGIHYILVSNSVSKLLPTIISRTEIINIRPITEEQSNKLLDSLNITDKVKRSQVLFMAMGRPAELIRLLTDEKYFDKRSKSVRDARELLRANMYQKLLIINDYKDDRSYALLLLSDVANILKQSISSNPQPELIGRIDSALKAYDSIESNGNIRLCLARMII